MHLLTELIHEDMKPALGVTEPGAIAFAVASARDKISGNLKKISLRLNSGMYKNACTCGIPGSCHVGNLYAAALGYLTGRPEKGLLCLCDVSEKDDAAAEKLVLAGMIDVVMTEISSRIYIQALVRTDAGEAIVTIRDSHTNIVKIQVNDQVIFSKEEQKNPEAANPAIIHQYTLQQICDYAHTVDIKELLFMKEAYTMNYALFEEGLASSKTRYAHVLLKQNGEKIISEDELKTASLLCNTAIEARVIGLDRPAMSITGSGAHGIIATLPLYAVAKANGLSEEKLLRATAVSYLVCMYIKEYSGKLSAFCGCGIAAGCGMACGVTYLKNGTSIQIGQTIRNMASSITGMICDGGNQGCTMKGIAAVDCAFRSAYFALENVSIDPVHGINGITPEETMRNMGRIASPGMVETEKEIVEIMKEKG